MPARFWMGSYRAKAIDGGNAAAAFLRGFRRFQTLCVAMLALSVLGVPPGSAESRSIPAPTGEVILTVSGAIENTNAPGEARFDLAMLEALPSHEIVTSTPWSKDTLTFTGPLARDLMDLVGATGNTVRAIALNDYKSEIPLSDFENYDVVIAVKLNGSYMRIRDKGPLWIAYPLDQVPEIRESAPPKMVWQLTRLVVE